MSRYILFYLLPPILKPYINVYARVDEYRCLSDGASKINSKKKKRKKVDK